MVPKIIQVVGEEDEAVLRFPPIPASTELRETNRMILWHSYWDPSEDPTPKPKATHTPQDRVYLDAAAMRSRLSRIYDGDMPAENGEQTGEGAPGQPGKSDS